MYTHFLMYKHPSFSNYYEYCLGNVNATNELELVECEFVDEKYREQNRSVKTF